MTGGQVAAPIFGNFMKVALADKTAAPFRIPPGIKLVRVSTCAPACARASEDRMRIMEAFKPSEEPDDAYSVIGFTDRAAAPSVRRRASAIYAAAAPEPTLGRGGLW